MHKRYSKLMAVCVCTILSGACNIGVDLTGLNFGYGTGSFVPTAGGSFMDPASGQLIVVGDTINIFFVADSTTVTWQYDSAAFAAMAPPDVVTHQGRLMSHIALRSRAPGITTVSATGRMTGHIDVEAVAASDIGGIGIQQTGTSIFKVGDTLTVVGTPWDKTGRTLNTNVTWTTTNSGVVAVTRNYSVYYYNGSVAVLTATGPGKATIGATVKGVSNSIDLTVIAR